MSVTNINANSGLTMPREFPAVIEGGNRLRDDDDSAWAKAPQTILQSALAALREGRVSEAQGE